MCSFYKERGLDLPKPGKIASLNRFGEPLAVIEHMWMCVTVFYFVSVLMCY